MKLGTVKVGDWVWVQFTERKFYAGLVQKVMGNYEFTVDFVRHLRHSTFVWPSRKDVSDIEYQQIVRIIKPPDMCRRGELTFTDSDVETS